MDMALANLVVGGIFTLPSGNLFRPTRVEPDEKTGETVVSGVYEYIAPHNENPDLPPMKTAHFTPEWFGKHAAAI